MKMFKIHGVEDYVFEQLEKCNGICRFIEDFIKQAHQCGMLDEKRTNIMRNRKKVFLYYSINE